MTTTASIQPPPLPSRRKLAATTAAAAAAAALVLVTLVLPAEYAIDPLHTGRALGLTRIAEPPPLPPSGPPTAAVYRSDALTITLDPYDYVEYKYRLPKDGVMVFSWKASAPLIQDFHGAPDGGGSGSEVSVERSTRSDAAGSLTAAFPGMHGWYFENPGSTPITITLRSAGFYTEAIEFRSDRTRHPHTLASEGSHK